MAERKYYDRQLRAIGQSLEAQRISIFELHHQGDRFIVKGEPEKETSLLTTLRNWQKRNRSEGLTRSLDFNNRDIDELDRQGRSNRAKADRLPDFHSVANILRTVGSHLEVKGAELIRLQKKELSISIVVRNRSGHPEFEERSLASFYQLFMRLHAGRKKPNR